MEPDLTFKQLCNLWQQDKKNLVKQSTMAAYSLLIEKYLIPYFENISDINNASVQSFMQEGLKNGLSLKSVRDIVVVLRMVMKFASSLGLPVNWNYRIKFQQKNNSDEISVLTVAHQKKLIEYLESHPSYKNLGILICLSTGLRIGEICGLKWQDINLSLGFLVVNKTVSRIYSANSPAKKTEIKITSPKTINSYRTIPLPARLVEIIGSLHDSVNDAHFLVSNSLQPIEPRSYRNCFYKLLDHLGIPKLKFHSLRHTFATRCIENNADYKTLSSILGHADISTTLNLYVHPSTEQKRRCIENMLASLGS